MKNESVVEPETPIHRMVAAAREGREPRVIARLYSGWAVFGERQFLRGYTLMLPDPVVPTLNALGSQQRAAYMQDVARLGDAVLKVTGAARINYAILGNQDPALHTHVIPRYADDPRPGWPFPFPEEEVGTMDEEALRRDAEALRASVTR
jgi:diadenosine tetraphosphate (Ap4A) HIT family hydrolase